MMALRELGVLREETKQEILTETVKETKSTDEQVPMKMVLKEFNWFGKADDYIVKEVPRNLFWRSTREKSSVLKINCS